MLKTVAHFAQATTPAIPSKTTSARVRSTFLFGGPDDGSAGDGPLSVWLSVLPRTSSPFTASPVVLLLIVSYLTFKNRQRLVLGLGLSNLIPNLCGQRRPLGSALLIGLLRPLAIPRQMRHDAEQALDDHQLSPVVNLMLLAADQHLEAAL